MKVIRGFSKKSGYDCSICHHKCCATEFDLPLLPHENDKIRQVYPHWAKLIKKENNYHKLMRGDSCPFLRVNGHCELHSTNLKPLICRIYPLIISRIDNNSVLIWIDPCRGNGFNWVAGVSHQIKNDEIVKLLQELIPYFTDYIGDEYNNDNPYTDVRNARIKEEEVFFEKTRPTTNYSLLTSGLKQCKSYLDTETEMLTQLNSQLNKKDRLIEIIESVFHWLSWSPVGLNLSFPNSKVIFSIAAAWVYSWSRELGETYVKHKEKQDIYNKMGSILATAILPSFWYQFSIASDDKYLKTFSGKIIQVLKGNLPQDNLLG